MGGMLKKDGGFLQKSMEIYFSRLSLIPLKHQIGVGQRG